MLNFKITHILDLAGILFCRCIKFKIVTQKGNSHTDLRIIHTGRQCCRQKTSRCSFISDTVTRTTNIRKSVGTVKLFLRFEIKPSKQFHFSSFVALIKYGYVFVCDMFAADRHCYPTHPHPLSVIAIFVHLPTSLKRSYAPVYFTEVKFTLEMIFIVQYVHLHHFQKLFGHTWVTAI